VWNTTPTPTQTWLWVIPFSLRLPVRAYFCLFQTLDGALLVCMDPRALLTEWHHILYSRHKSHLSIQTVHVPLRTEDMDWTTLTWTDTPGPRKSRDEGVDLLPLPKNISPSPTSEVSWVKMLFHVALCVTMKKCFPRSS
jgi:hypothetical protein